MDINLRNYKTEDTQDFGHFKLQYSATQHCTITMLETGRFNWPSEDKQKKGSNIAEVNGSSWF
jgi:hypothetical protein